MGRYRDNVKRSRALKSSSLSRAARELDFGGDANQIRDLVEMRWIISENWLNAQEFLGREINVETILSGYDLVLSLLRPYFVREESNVMSESREAIRAYLEKNLNRLPRSAAS
ncbi:MAG: hypothetical protein R3C60_15420 [Parvularculaceae bacterium]